MDVDAVDEKLRYYSLKLSAAQQKFHEAFTLQKDFMKAVSRMRYEFTNSLSVEQKRLLEQAGF